MNKCTKAKKGFSIADILVSMTIIAIVTALTVPTLIKSTNTRKNYTALKKNLSVLNSAIQNCISKDEENASSSAINSSATLAAYMSRYLQKVKTSNSTVWLSDGTKYKFVYVLPNPPHTGCAPLGTDNGNTYSLSADSFDPALNCYVIVDVNGDKSPNTVADTTFPADIYILGISPSAVFSVVTDNNEITIDGTAPNGFHRVDGSSLRIIGDDGVSIGNAGTVSVGNNASVNALRD